MLNCAKTNQSKNNDFEPIDEKPKKKPATASKTAAAQQKKAQTSFVENEPE